MRQVEPRNAHHEFECICKCITLLRTRSNLLSTTDLVTAMGQGDLGRARRLQGALHQLMLAIFVETNPIPIKAVLAELGRIGETVRSPLTPLADTHRVALTAALTASLESVEVSAP